LWWWYWHNDEGRDKELHGLLKSSFIRRQLLIRQTNLSNLLPLFWRSFLRSSVEVFDSCVYGSKNPLFRTTGDRQLTFSSVRVGSDGHHDFDVLFVRLVQTSAQPHRDQFLTFPGIQPGCVFQATIQPDIVGRVSGGSVGGVTVEFHQWQPVDRQPESLWVEGHNSCSLQGVPQDSGGVAAGHVAEWLLGLWSVESQRVECRNICCNDLSNSLLS